MPRIDIHQHKSAIGEKADAKRTLVALGLRKIGQSTVRPDTPVFRGMIHTVRHLVRVEEVD